MMSENALLSIYSYLWNFDIADFNPLPPPNKLPLTKHHRELLQYKPPLERFLLHFVTKMLHEREDELEMTAIDRYRNPSRITSQMIEKQNRKGFIALSGKRVFGKSLNLGVRKVMETVAKSIIGNLYPRRLKTKLLETHMVTLLQVMTTRIKFAPSNQEQAQILKTLTGTFTNFVIITLRKETLFLMETLLSLVHVIRLCITLLTLV